MVSRVIAILVLNCFLCVLCTPLVIIDSFRTNQLVGDLENVEIKITENNELPYNDGPWDTLDSVKQNVRGPRRYVLGQRTAGDALVGQVSQNNRYPTMQNVNITVAYPKTGFGKLITYVEINVMQTSEQGQAYILEGGLHQHMVKILVQAFNTYQMDYSALIYGI